MENVKVTVKIKNKKTLLANANISVKTSEFGWITLKNFPIWESNVRNERLGDNVNITPPSIAFRGKYFQIFFFEDKEKWYEVERKIYDCYLEAVSDQEIDINEIPDDLSNSNNNS